MCQLDSGSMGRQVMLTKSTGLPGAEGVVNGGNLGGGIWILAKSDRNTVAPSDVRVIYVATLPWMQ